MTWEECLEKNDAKETREDKNRANSLVKTSENRMKHVLESEIKDYNASTLFSEAYEALLQICQAIISLRGYKVYNHVCITSFLDEVLGEKSMSNKFDRYRKVRNGINYYGEEVGENFAEKAISEIEDMISSLKTDFLEDIET